MFLDESSSFYAQRDAVEAFNPKPYNLKGFEFREEPCMKDHIRHLALFAQSLSS